MVDMATDWCIFMRYAITDKHHSKIPKIPALTTTIPTKRPLKGALEQKYPVHEIVADKLWFTFIDTDKLVRLPKRKGFTCVCLDDWFEYPDLRNYHGPLNAAGQIRFSEWLADEDAHVLVVSARWNPKRSNAAIAIGSWLMQQRGFTADQTIVALAPILASMPGFRTEGSEAFCTERISVTECLRAMEKFTSLGLYDLSSMDADWILEREDPTEGDLNWIIPDRIMALAGPTEETFPIESFLEIAEAENIGALFRLNEDLYDAKVLTNAGIKHYDLPFADCTCPSLAIIKRFLKLASKNLKANKAIAVHCRAGLGRTGTLIACHVISSYGTTARETIAWLRMLRPGMILGHQQLFLEAIQWWLRDEQPTSSELAFIQRVLGKEAKRYYRK